MPSVYTKTCVTVKALEVYFMILHSYYKSQLQKKVKKCRREYLYRCNVPYCNKTVKLLFYAGIVLRIWNVASTYVYLYCMCMSERAQVIMSSRRLSISTIFELITYTVRCCKISSFSATIYIYQTTSNLYWQLKANHSAKNFK